MTQSKILIQNQEEKENANAKGLHLRMASLCQVENIPFFLVKGNICKLYTTSFLRTLSVKTNKWLARKGMWFHWNSFLSLGSHWDFPHSRHTDECFVRLLVSSSLLSNGQSPISFASSASQRFLWQMPLLSPLFLPYSNKACTIWGVLALLLSCSLNSNQSTNLHPKVDP
jgi:hypothetical protein